MFDNHNMSLEELQQAGYREYRGEQVNVYFHKNICQHAAECVRGNNSVFNIQQKPWIQPDQASPEEVREIIQSCPSGALKYLNKEEV